MGKLQSAIDNLTGHKSKHYSTSEVIQSEMVKAQKEREIQRMNQMIGSRDPYSASPNQGSNPGSMYSHAQMGLQPYQAGVDQQALDQEHQRQTAKEAMDSVANYASTQMANNDLASQMRFGGKFTRSGLQQADKDATLNAMDRLRAKSMIGIGGTMVMQPYNPTGTRY